MHPPSSDEICDVFFKGDEYLDMVPKTQFFQQRPVGQPASVLDLVAMDAHQRRHYIEHLQPGEMSVRELALWYHYCHGVARETMKPMLAAKNVFAIAGLHLALLLPQITGPSEIQFTDDIPYLLHKAMTVTRKSIDRCKGFLVYHPWDMFYAKFLNISISKQCMSLE